ncbi:hypothetical protein PPTG_16460 [Phytophthora nicotianae INRA-310]|uniref:Uncharacterized protein n=2 Tax=Phytophthora nicotianae TaxID=4792 RepID=W2PNR2_PHYN3|nr:hypothetical protein PPTG_16460 [Phytophthora nicotianae INRA-310]ETN02507.1 hypothetical protein PPTG_16460 [Phytophthora nicotianae INRA-310]KUF82963.1 hypothetical protein AM587_10003939 [Phytophthora nicotianae]
MTDGIPPLLVVELLFRAKNTVAHLSHVVEAVSLYLDSSVELPLHKACKFNSLKLLNRLYASSSILLQQTKNETGYYWSLRTLIRRETHYRQFQFTKSLMEAIRTQNLEIITWICTKFPRKTVTPEVVELATTTGSLPILQYFCDNDNTVLADRRFVAKRNVGFRVEWGSQILSAAIASHRGDIVWWLDNTVTASFDWNKALTTAVISGDILMAEWLLSQGAMWSRRSRGRCMAHDVVSQGRLDVLRWLENRDCLDDIVGLVVIAAQCGHLEIVRWLIDRDVVEGGDLTHLGKEASLAIHIAAVNGHLQVAKYLRIRAQIPTSAVECVLQRAEQSTQLRELSVQLDTKNEATRVSWKTAAIAAGRGHLDVVRWLCEEYADGQEVNLFVDYKTDKKISAAMDTAARNGRLEVLEYLHNLQKSIDTPLKKRKRDEMSPPSPICSKAAMDEAAANGHLSVVQWLHENRTEGCSIEAVDAAAAGGHLDVVRWLHEHRKQGCTTAAMDGAARNGHLEMIQWLNDNTSAGCTTAAMDHSAMNGHIAVVKWLHEHRNEECTVAAMNGAAANGFLNVVKFLHCNRTEGCTTAAMDNAAKGGHLQIVQWLHCHREEGCTRAAIDNAAASGHFEVFLFLRYVCSQTCTVKTVQAASGKGSQQILAWIRANYRALRNVRQQ